MTEGDERPDTAGHAPRIAVECLQCGRVAEIADALPLVQLTRRLRCSACGSRAVKAARMGPTSAPEEARPTDTPRDVARLMRARIEAGRRR